MYIARRKLLATLLGGAAAWPLTARAQQPERMRRVGVLMSVADGPEGKARLGAFLEGLQQLGWTDGRNVRIETRWATTNADDLRKHVESNGGRIKPKLLAILIWPSSLPPRVLRTAPLPPGSAWPGRIF
jgi:hypothetical protein